MPPKIVISPFAQIRDQKNCKCPLSDLLGEITANFTAAKPGYRDGVVLIPINPAPFTGQIVILQEGDKLQGNYEARVTGETPRKTLNAHNSTPAPIKAVDVVLYRKDVLAEGNEGSDPTADWEVITFLPKISEEEQPMPPDTLLANHFQDSGGTATHMDNTEFIAALKKSYFFWRDKAIIALAQPQTVPAIPEPTRPLDLLDAATKETQAAGHRLQNETATGHMEYAMAHLREAWIAESGQNARNPELLHNDVKKGLKFIDIVLEKTMSNTQTTT